MVLESVLDPKQAASRPLRLFLTSVVYSFVALYAAHLLFPSQSSILTVAMVTILFVPFFQKLFEADEELEERPAKGNLLVRHRGTLEIFSVFFLGVVCATVLSYTFMPGMRAAFTLQSETLHSFGTASATGQGSFAKFFLNNSQVMLLTFALSILFGAGAVFILAWNASVIGVYAGSLVQTLAARGTPAGLAFAYGVPASLGSIALHGIPEILAYLVAGMAGGILSVGMVREKFGSAAFRLVFRDAVKLLVAAEFLIVVAAFIEAL